MDHPMFEREYPSTRWERASTVTSISQPWNPVGAPSGFCGRTLTYTHFRAVWSILRGSPNTSCNRLTGFPTLSAAMLGTERTAYPEWQHPAKVKSPRAIAAPVTRNIIRLLFHALWIAVLPAAQSLAADSSRRIGI